MRVWKPIACVGLDKVMDIKCTNDPQAKTIQDVPRYAVQAVVAALTKIEEKRHAAKESLRQGRL